MQYLFKKFFVEKEFTRWASVLVWPGYLISIILVGYGSYLGLYEVPADVTQGEVFRIIYIHVPMAVLSLALYVAMGVSVILERGMHIKMADTYALAIAIVGVVVTGLAIVTGAIWAKPTWGAWWIWDARITSEIILLMLYLGYITTRVGIVPNELGKEVSSWVAIVGIVDVPFVHYSVNWWYTLHQGATVLQFARPKMPWIMLYPLLITMIGSACLVGVLIIHTAWILRKMSTKAHAQRNTSISILQGI